MTVLVFANGDLETVSWIRPYLQEATAIIAADGGTNHLWRLGQRPDLLIGDMDSLPEVVRSWLAEQPLETIVSPTAKDETDLELALLHAATHYEEKILVFAAFGGRLDQTLSNILLLVHPALGGQRVELVTPYERAWLVTDATRIHGEVGDRVSLVPLGGDVHVTATEGLRWPLRDEVLTFGPARGVSNVMTAVEATVTLRSGFLLCIHTQQAWQR